MYWHKEPHVPMATLAGGMTASSTAVGSNDSKWHSTTVVWVSKALLNIDIKARHIQWSYLSSVRKIDWSDTVSQGKLFLLFSGFLKVSMRKDDENSMILRRQGLFKAVSAGRANSIPILDAAGHRSHKSIPENI
jgi:hypothetical protein